MTLLQLYGACALAGAGLAFWREPRLPRYNLLLVDCRSAAAGRARRASASPACSLVLAAAVVVWCLANRSLAGIPALAVGLAMNLTVMALHGGAMPVAIPKRSRGLACRRARRGPAAARLEGYRRADTSPLGLLADWLVLRAGPGHICRQPRRFGGGDWAALVAAAQPYAGKGCSYVDVWSWQRLSCAPCSFLAAALARP